jgi:cytochrome c biogenesis protein CcdA
MKGSVPNVSLNIGEEKETKTGWLTVVVTFLFPALLVAGLVYLLVRLRGGLEASVAHLAAFLPVGYAFGAGMVASVNPCGVLMLPTYVFYHLGSGDSGVSATRRLLKGLLVGLVATAGFVVIFALVGGVIAAGGRWLIGVFPYAGFLIGVGMLGLGVWLLITRKTFGIQAARRVTVSPRRSLGNMFLFGITYAIGSLSCTLPIFLVVVGSGLASGGLAASFGQFIGYALGMGTIIIIVTAGTALFRQAVSRWMQRMTGYVNRISAMFLIGAGAYLIYYWVVQAGL